MKKKSFFKKGGWLLFHSLCLGLIIAGVVTLFGLGSSQAGPAPIRHKAHLSGGGGTYTNISGAGGFGSGAYLNIDNVQLQSDCQRVQAYVTPKNDKNQTEDSLTDADFTVKEDGAGLSFYMSKIQNSTNNPLTIALVLDRSGSLSWDFQNLKNAARDFVSRMNPNDRAEILYFSSTVDSSIGFTNDKPTLIAEIDKYSYASGWTSLYDAVNSALDHLSTETGKRAVFVFTDGDDNGSAATSASVIAKALGTTSTVPIPIYTVGYESYVNSTVLQSMATSTGGTYNSTNDLAQLAAIYQAMSTELSTSYLLEYNSPNASDGNDHTMSISFASGASAHISGNVPTGTASYTYSACAAKGPKVDGFTPSSGKTGDKVTITGSGFLDSNVVSTSGNSVLFNGVPATVLGSSTTTIEAEVPQGASTGKISVVVGPPAITVAANGTVTVKTPESSKDFIVDGLAAPFNLRADASVDNIEVKWDAVTDPDVVQYELIRSDIGGCFDTSITTCSGATVETVYTGTNTLFMDTNLKKKVTIKYLNTNSGVADDYSLDACGDAMGCSGKYIPARYYYIAKADYGAAGKSDPSNEAGASLSTASIFVPDVQVPPGTDKKEPDFKFKLPVSIKNADNIYMAAAQVFLNYDSTILTLDTSVGDGGLERTDLVTGMGWAVNTKTKGKINVALATGQSDTTLAGEGTLFYINFKVSKTAKEGDFDSFSFTSNDDPANQETATKIWHQPSAGSKPLELIDVPLNTEGGTVTVKCNYKLGDPNGSCTTKADDATYDMIFASDLVKPSWPLQTWAGDIDGDEAIYANDAAMILYRVVNGTFPNILAGGSTNLQSLVLERQHVLKERQEAGQSVKVSLRKKGSDVEVVLDKGSVGSSKIVSATLKLAFSKNAEARSVKVNSAATGFSNTKKKGAVVINLTEDITKSKKYKGLGAKDVVLATVSFKSTAALKGIQVSDANLFDDKGRNITRSRLKAVIQKSGIKDYKSGK